MAEPRKPDNEGRAGEEQETAPETKPTGKTLQELERLQFDALDRAGQNR